MARFNIEGRWYDVADYKTARAEHLKWKNGPTPVKQAAPAKVAPPKAVATPQAVSKLKPVVKPKPVVTPVALGTATVAVAVVTSPAASSPVGIASELKLFRGDERTADVIARDGFQLWGDAVAAVSAAGGIAEFILHKLYNAYANERDIERYIVTAKNRSRPTISTSRNDGCGGYDSGNIYRIEYGSSELQEYLLDDVMRAYSPTVSGAKYPNFKLYMDRPDIKTAKQIALDLNIATQEVVFFRHVPGDKIAQYKLKGGKVFQAMPAAAARARLW